MLAEARKQRYKDINQYVVTSGALLKQSPAVPFVHSKEQAHTLRQKLRDMINKTTVELEDSIICVYSSHTN